MSGALKDQLEFGGYEIDIASVGEEGLKKIEDNSYDLILLDVMLPKKSGFDVCREIRDKKIKTPVLMLTAKGEEIDKVLDWNWVPMTILQNLSVCVSFRHG